MYLQQEFNNSFASPKVLEKHTRAVPKTSSDEPPAPPAWENASRTTTLVACIPRIPSTPGEEYQYHMRLSSSLFPFPTILDVIGRITEPLSKSSMSMWLSCASLGPTTPSCNEIQALVGLKDQRFQRLEVESAGCSPSKILKL